MRATWKSCIRQQLNQFNCLRDATALPCPAGDGREWQIICIRLKIVAILLKIPIRLYWVQVIEMPHNPVALISRSPGLRLTRYSRTTIWRSQIECSPSCSRTLLGASPWRFTCGARALRQKRSAIFYPSPDFPPPQSSSASPSRKLSIQSLAGALCRCPKF